MHRDLYSTRAITQDSGNDITMVPQLSASTLQRKSLSGKQPAAIEESDKRFAQLKILLHELTWFG
jgi:hypothetical protein